MLGASSTSYRRSMMFANDPGAVVAQIIFSITDAFALTMLVFLRRGFGERFLTVFKYGLGIAILSFLMTLRALASEIMGVLPFVLGGVSPLLGLAAGAMAGGSQRRPVGLFDGASLLYWAFVLWGGFQLALVLYRSYWPGNSVPVHSKSMGEPLLSFGRRINHAFTTIVLEPVAVLLLGYVLVACDPSLPFSYFMCLSLFIQASALHQWRLARDERLDEQDARIVAGFYTAQAKRTAVDRTTPTLGAFFGSLLRLRAPEMQAGALARWSRQHHEGGPPALAPSADARASGDSAEPPAEASDGPASSPPSASR
jgi:hypothetical protein